MQRWFFLEDPHNAFLRASGKEGKRKWCFRVQVPKLRRDEVVCVSGNIPELGSWHPEKCVRLTREDYTDIWSKTIVIPDTGTVQYRYCVCVVFDEGHEVMVRSWEAYLKPRLAKSPSGEDYEKYGKYANTERVDRGWLNKETVIQLQFANKAVSLLQTIHSNRRVYIKVTPVENFEKPKYSLTEVASLSAENSSFHHQARFGEEYKENGMLIFQSTVLFPENVAFFIGLYVSAQGAKQPQRAGFSYLLPTLLQSSEGSLILPVRTMNHRLLGEIRVAYTIIKPMPNIKFDMSVSYQRYWNKTRTSLHVGHRGSGSTFKKQGRPEYRENTIASLKHAIDHGADYVEFDVQLSKDLVPVVYHDFKVCISTRNKDLYLDKDHVLEMPVKELTLEQLQLLEVYHVNESKMTHSHFVDEDHRLFPTLQHVLEVLHPCVGFNIDVKWTMQFYDGTYESLYHPMDANIYVDKILEVVLRHAAKRRIVFSCFNPDVCAMFRLKQNKYPVLFLTVGESDIHAPYKDPRCWSVPRGVQYAGMMELLGLSVHAENILKDRSLVLIMKRAGLVVFSWGDHNANPATIKLMKGLGLDAVIYDKISEHLRKEVKESIFLIEARQFQLMLD